MSHFTRNKYIEQNPTDAWAVARRGRLYQEQGRYQDALLDFNQAIDFCC